MVDACRSKSGSPPTLMSTVGLSIRFEKNGHSTTLVDDVNLSLDSSQSVGLIGESGSGKTLTCLSLLGLIDSPLRVTGAVEFDGRAFSASDDKAFTGLRGRQIAMIFQDSVSSLNPVRTIGSQLIETIARHKPVTRHEAETEARQLLERVGLSDTSGRMRAYPHELSGGLCQRAMIALALCASPKLLIADEPTTALDVTTQQHILALLQELVNSEGISLLFVSHDLGSIAQSVDRIIVMYGGRIIESGLTRAVFESPRHPYTEALIATRPRLRSLRGKPLTTIPGATPTNQETAAGCVFAARCGVVQPRCRNERPALDLESGHAVACFYPRSTPSRLGAQ